jgi:hypothetical protein
MTPATPAHGTVIPSGYTVDRSFAPPPGRTLPTLALALAEARQHVGETVTELLSSGGGCGGQVAGADIRLGPVGTMVVRLTVSFAPPPGSAVPPTDGRLRAALLDPEQAPTAPGASGTYSVWLYRNASFASRDEGFETFTAALAHGYDRIHALTEDLARYRRVSRRLCVCAEVRLPSLPVASAATTKIIYMPPDPDLIPTSDRELAHALRAERKAGPR